MKKLSVIALMLALVLAVGLVSAGPNDLPGTGWNSGQQIQNVGSSAGTVNLMAYDQDGNSYDCGNQALNPGESYTYLPDNDCAMMPAGFQGSAVASADQPIAAVVNVNNAGVGKAAEQYTGTDGSAVSTTIVFPLVKSNHAGRTTTFYVQNASTSTNNIHAEFVVGGNTYTNDFNNVPANAMVIVNPADAGVPQGTGNVGALTVTGTQPIAGSSLEHETTASVAANLQASRGFVPSDFGGDLYCPLARYQFGGLNTSTGLQVMNVSGGTEDIQITYKVSYPSPHTVGPFTVSNVPNGSSANFLASDHLNPGELGAISVHAVGGGDLAAITNDRADGPNPKRFTTYSCFAASNATTTVSLPLVKEDFFSNTTGVQIQNVGNGPATFTLTYKTGAGNTVVISHSDPVAVGGSKTFYRVASGGTANIQVNSGTLSNLTGAVSGVTITSNQPIVAIANESNYTGANAQDTKNYEGFNQ
ncbi:MAG: hypothetical protein WAM60_17885 [Candidatus Promineifilaceae bacterium]